VAQGGFFQASSLVLIESLAEIHSRSDQWGSLSYPHPLTEHFSKFQGLMDTGQADHGLYGNNNLSFTMQEPALLPDTTSEPASDFLSMLLSSNYTQQALDRGLFPPSQPHISSMNYNNQDLPKPAFPVSGPSLLLQPFRPEPYLQRKATEGRTKPPGMPSGSSISRGEESLYFAPNLENLPPAYGHAVRRQPSAVGPSLVELPGSSQQPLQVPNQLKPLPSKAKPVSAGCTLLLTPFNASSRQHVLSLGHAVNVSVPSK